MFDYDCAECDLYLHTLCVCVCVHVCVCVCVCAAVQRLRDMFVCHLFLILFMFILVDENGFRFIVICPFLCNHLFSMLSLQIIS